jgi:hypothetical protein
VPLKLGVRDTFELGPTGQRLLYLEVRDAITKKVRIYRDLRGWHSKYE